MLAGATAPTGPVSTWTCCRSARRLLAPPGPPLGAARPTRAGASRRTARRAAMEQTTHTTYLYLSSALAAGSARGSQAPTSSTRLHQRRPARSRCRIRSCRPSTTTHTSPWRQTAHTCSILTAGCFRQTTCRTASSMQLAPCRITAEATARITPAASQRAARPTAPTRPTSAPMASVPASTISGVCTARSSLRQ